MKTNLITVTAAAGVRVPTEDKPNVYITDKPVEVARSIYYIRRIADGDLLVVDTGTKTKKGGK